MKPDYSHGLRGALAELSHREWAAWLMRNGDAQYGHGMRAGFWRGWLCGAGTIAFAFCTFERWFR